MSYSVEKNLVQFTYFKKIINMLFVNDIGDEDRCLYRRDSGRYEPSKRNSPRHRDVGEGFGKPALVAFDVCLPKGGGVSPAILSELLDVATKAVWDNPELAPVAIRGRIIAASDSLGSETTTEKAAGAPGVAEFPESGGDAGTRGGEGIPEAAPLRGAHTSVSRVLADMMELGFLDETARPEGANPILTRNRVNETT